MPLCTTCEEEEDAPIPLEGNGTGVQVWAVVTSESKPLHDIAMCVATPYPATTRSNSPSYYEPATVCTTCASTLDYYHCAKDVLPLPPPAEHVIILSPIHADVPNTGRIGGYNVVGTLSSSTSSIGSAIGICSSCKDNKEADIPQREEEPLVRMEVTHGGRDAQSQDPIR